MYAIFLVAATVAYSGLGCFQLDANPGHVVLNSSAPFALTDCISRCVAFNSSVQLVAVSIAAPIGSNICSCLTQLYSLKVNIVECGRSCSDGITCGGILDRATIYFVDTTDVTNAKASSVPSPTRNPNLDVSTGMGSKLETWKIAVIVAAIILLLAIITVSVWFHLNNRKGTNTLPRLPKSSSFLISDLPKTREMIYSVVRPHVPAQKDEIVLLKDNVVALRTVYTDGWALATNVTTGESGMMPLICFVDSGLADNRIDSSKRAT